MNDINSDITAKRFANLILDIGTFLMASGAHCGRINNNIQRFAGKWGFDANMQLTFKGLLVSIRNLNNPEDTVTLYKESPSHHVHLAIITEVSQLSWRVIEDNLTIGEAEEEFEKIKNKSNYNRWVMAVAVAISCAGLCVFASGDIYNAAVTFIAAFTGFVVRCQIARMNFNPMISVAIAAAITTIIAGIGSLQHIGGNPQAAMATAVLYLIPGVPLINAVIDLIEGYLSSAMNRALFAGFMLLCIAAGMTFSITLMGISNF